MDTQILLNFGLVLLFVLVGGVFAATEIALVSLRDSQLTRMEREGARGAKVASVARDPNRFLAAVQIGVTVAGFFSAAYGGSTLAPALSPTLEAIGVPEGAAETTALAVMTLLIAYLSLVLGELVPKRLALQKSAGLAMAVTPTLDRFAILMRPVIWLLSISTNALVRLLGGDPKATGEELSEEELRDLVSTHEGLEDDERQILQDVFNASRTTLREVMQPRADVVFVDATTPLVEAGGWVRDQPYSRYPITGDGGFDDVLGFLHVRDLLAVEAGDSRTVGDVAREVLVLPRTNMVLPAVQEMRQSRTHLAVVVDEYGGTDGIVTLEDLVEELVGEIEDEYDAGEPADSDDPTLDGGTTLEDVAERTGVVLPDDGDYETVAGFVLARLGRIPAVGDSAPLDDGGSVEVQEMVGRRITRVQIHPAPERAEDPSDGSPATTTG